MNNIERLKILIAKYLDKSCTAGEQEELFERIKKTSGPDEVDSIFREVWAGTGRSESLHDLTWEHLLELSASRKAKKRKIRVMKMNVWRWAAAAAVILVVFFVGTWWNNNDDLLVYKTDYGETLHVDLDDGTAVMLNANSRMTWDRGWKKNGVRRVELEGEAFFDVSQLNPAGEPSDRSGKLPPREGKMPFEVLTSDLVVDVLGTAFNVLKRRERTEVYLERGSVVLKLNKEGDRSGGSPEPEKEISGDREAGGVRIVDETDTVQMKPGDLVRFSLEDDVLTKQIVIDPYDQGAWREGVLTYRDVEFRVMLENLEDIYGKSFEVEEADLLKTRVDFGVPYKDWETVTRLMESMLKLEITEIGESQVKISKRKGR